MAWLVQADKVISLESHDHVTVSHQMTCHLIEEGSQMVMSPCIVKPAMETQNGFARGISPCLNKSTCTRFGTKCCEVITFPAMCPYGTGILISVASPEMKRLYENL